MPDLRDTGENRSPVLPIESAPLLQDAPTDSHALATSEHEEVGAAQQPHMESNAKDLGWNEKPEEIADPLVGGLSNEQVWMLIRRFNMQIYHVKALPEAPPGGLDLNVASEDDFSPAKMRNNIERLYMSVGVGLTAFYKHLARLSSWNEKRRSAAFCSAYFVAWFFDLIFPALLLMVLTLIVYPPARTRLFPPMPLALVSSGGNLKKPSAGMLGSADTITGAPEKYEGEAAEKEASNFVSFFTAISISSATGEHVSNDSTNEGGVADAATQDPSKIASHAAEAKDVASGRDGSSKHDKTKQPMEAAMWEKTRPIMHILGDIADTWERFGNLLSPVAPFPKWKGRTKIVGALVPLILVTAVINSHYFAKGFSFVAGAGFFGQTLIFQAVQWVNTKYPGWTKYLELQNSLLKGVPTNAQLSITLLRIGEANKAPLPPPPSINEVPPTKPLDVNADDLPIEVSHEDVAEAIHPEDEYLEKVEDEKNGESNGKRKHGRRTVAFLKGTTKAAVATVLGTDKVRAKAGSMPAKNRLGVLPNPKVEPTSGPILFKARYKGKKGSAVLDAASALPTIGFRLDGDDESAFTINVKDIVELRKTAGLGWKSKLVVGWSMSREVAEGITITDKTGTARTLTAMERQEELFNRLVAIGGQIWESW